MGNLNGFSLSCRNRKPRLAIASNVNEVLERANAFI